MFGTGIVAPPVTCAPDGQQYIAIGVGWNGVEVVPWTPDEPLPFDNAGRLIVLKLEGGPVPVAQQQPLSPFFAGNEPQDQAMVARGLGVYQIHCSRCHGVVGESGIYPDLRRMSLASHDAFLQNVRGGLLATGGMGSFAEELSEDDALAARAFVVDWAQRSRNGDLSVVPFGLRSVQGRSTPSAT